MNIFKLWTHSTKLPFGKVVPGTHFCIVPVSLAPYPCQHGLFFLILANLIDERCYCIILISLIIREVGHVPCVYWSLCLSPPANCSCPLHIFLFPLQNLFEI